MCSIRSRYRERGASSIIPERARQCSSISTRNSSSATYIASRLHSPIRPVEPLKALERKLTHSDACVSLTIDRATQTTSRFTMIPRSDLVLAPTTPLSPTAPAIPDTPKVENVGKRASGRGSKGRVTPVQDNDVRTGPACDSLPTPQSLPKGRRRRSTLIYAQTSCRQPLTGNYGGYFNAALERPNRTGNARRGSRDQAPCDLRDGPYDADDNGDASPGRPGRLRQVPTTHPLSPAPQLSRAPIAVVQSPDETTSLGSSSQGGTGHSGDKRATPSYTGMMDYKLPLMHVKITALLDPLGLVYRLVDAMVSKVGLPCVQEPVPADPRPIPDTLVSSSFTSYRALADYTGVNVSYSP